MLICFEFYSTVSTHRRRWTIFSCVQSLLHLWERNQRSVLEFMSPFRRLNVVRFLSVSPSEAEWYQTGQTRLRLRFYAVFYTGYCTSNILDFSLSQCGSKIVPLKVIFQILQSWNFSKSNLFIRITFLGAPLPIVFELNAFIPYILYFVLFLLIVTSRCLYLIFFAPLFLLFDLIVLAIVLLARESYS